MSMPRRASWQWASVEPGLALARSAKDFVTLLGMRRGCRAFVESLDLPRVSSVRDLLPEVERHCRKPVVLQGEPRVRTGLSCGLAKVTPDLITVFYESCTSIPQQDHIIAHEFGHLLCDHHGTPERPRHRAGLSTLGEDSASLMLARNAFDDLEERQAEQVGSFLIQRVHGPRPLRRTAGRDPQADRVFSTLLGIERRRRR